jgi:hypothetical protein
MNEDEIRSLLLRAGPPEQPPPGIDLGELIVRGRRRRKARGYLVMAGSAAVAVLIVAIAVGHLVGVQPVVPANAPTSPVFATTPAAPASTADSEPTTTHSTTTANTATTSNTSTSAASSSAETTTP